MAVIVLIIDWYAAANLYALYLSKKFPWTKRVVGGWSCYALPPNLVSLQSQLKNDFLSIAVVNYYYTCFHSKGIP